MFLLSDKCCRWRLGLTSAAVRLIKFIRGWFGSGVKKSAGGDEWLNQPGWQRSGGAIEIIHPYPKIKPSSHQSYLLGEVVVGAERVVSGLLYLPKPAEKYVEAAVHLRGYHILVVGIGEDYELLPTGQLWKLGLRAKAIVSGAPAFDPAVVAYLGKNRKPCLIKVMGVYQLKHEQRVRLLLPTYSSLSGWPQEGRDSRGYLIVE